MGPAENDDIRMIAVDYKDAGGWDTFPYMIRRTPWLSLEIEAFLTQKSGEALTTLRNGLAAEDVDEIDGMVKLAAAFAQDCQAILCYDHDIMDQWDGSYYGKIRQMYVTPLANKLFDDLCHASDADLWEIRVFVQHIEMSIYEVTVKGAGQMQNGETDTEEDADSESTESGNTLARRLSNLMLSMSDTENSHTSVPEGNRIDVDPQACKSESDTGRSDQRQPHPAMTDDHSRPVLLSDLPDLPDEASPAPQTDNKNSMDPRTENGETSHGDTTQATISEPEKGN